MPFLDRLANFAIPFSVLKSFLGQKLYLQGLAVLAGVYYFVTRRKVDHLFYPLLAMIGLNLIVAFFYDQVGVTSVRLIQFTSMIGLCHYFWKVFDHTHIHHLLLSWEVIATVLYAIELVFNKPGATHWLFVGMPRYDFLVGEPNFSSLLLIVIFLIRMERKEYPFALWNLGLIFLAGSRTAGSVVILFALFQLIRVKLPSKISRLIFRLGLVALILAPFAMRGLNRFLPDDIKRSLILKSSNRYYIHQIYIDMSLKNPLGVGYFNGFSEYPRYRVHFDDYLKEDLDMKSGTQIAEQHNAYMQTLSEFGWPGFILFWHFLINLYRRLESSAYQLIPPFLGILIFINFLNVFNEVAFYFFIAFLLKSSPDEEIKAEPAP